ncbi:MAG: hypothetical protein AB7S38_02260 [Vulcanimicrobiota bacterium]
MRAAFALWLAILMGAPAWAQNQVVESLDLELGNYTWRALVSAPVEGRLEVSFLTGQRLFAVGPEPRWVAMTCPWAPEWGAARLAWRGPEGVRLERSQVIPIKFAVDPTVEAGDDGQPLVRFGFLGTPPEEAKLQVPQEAVPPGDPIRWRVDDAEGVPLHGGGEVVARLAEVRAYRPELVLSLEQRPQQSFPLELTDRIVLEIPDQLPVAAVADWIDRAHRLAPPQGVYLRARGPQVERQVWLALHHRAEGVWLDAMPERLRDEMARVADYLKDGPVAVPGAAALSIRVWRGDGASLLSVVNLSQQAQEGRLRLGPEVGRVFGLPDGAPIEPVEGELMLRLSAGGVALYILEAR